MFSLTLWAWQTRPSTVWQSLPHLPPLGPLASYESCPPSSRHTSFSPPWGLCTHSQAAFSPQLQLLSDSSAVRPRLALEAPLDPPQAEGRPLSEVFISTDFSFRPDQSTLQLGSSLPWPHRGSGPFLLIQRNTEPRTHCTLRKGLIIGFVCELIKTYGKILKYVTLPTVTFQYLEFILSVLGSWQGRRAVGRYSSISCWTTFFTSHVLKMLDKIRILWVKEYPRKHRVLCSEGIWFWRETGTQRQKSSQWALYFLTTLRNSLPSQGSFFSFWKKDICNF